MTLAISFRERVSSHHKSESKAKKLRAVSAMLSSSFYEHTIAPTEFLCSYIVCCALSLVECACAFVQSAINLIWSDTWWYKQIRTFLCKILALTTFQKLISDL